MKDVYIVDIDGTLADLSHRLHFIQSDPKEWDAFYDACDEDKPIWGVISVIQALTDARYAIVFVTGRPERVRNETNKWLRYNGLLINTQTLTRHPLIMRADGDHRPDTEVKKELVEKLIADGYRIAGVFEDRPSVCRVWREMGFTVFQMTDKEF